MSEGIDNDVQPHQAEKADRKNLEELPQQVTVKDFHKWISKNGMLRRGTKSTELRLPASRDA